MSLRVFVSVFVIPPLLSCLPTPLHGQSAAEAVRGEIIRHYEAISAGDTETVTAQHGPHIMAFLADGGPLYVADSYEEQETVFAQADLGSADWTPREILVDVYGDLAVAAFYLDGHMVSGAGERTEGTWRVTEVWRQGEGGWKEVHHHDNHMDPEGGEGTSSAAEATVTRIRYQWEAVSVGALAEAVDQGRTPQEYGRSIGKLFSGSWGESLTPQGFANGMISNLELVGAEPRLVEESPEGTTIKTTRPWVETWDARYEGWGISVGDYEEWLEGVLQGIGDPFGISVETERQSDALRMTFMR